MITKKLTTLLLIVLLMIPQISFGADVPMLDKIKSGLDSPLGTLIMSTIGTVYSGMLYKAAAKQEEDSKANVVKLDKLIASFKDSYINFCPSGRESLTEPKCYCYLDSGKQNPDRTNSQICKDQWAKDTYQLSAAPGDYSTTKTTDAVGCVKANGDFDENCTCKKFVDAKGVNSCMKTTNLTLPAGLGTGVASALGLQQVTDLSNSAANGSANLTIDSSALNSKAIAAKKTADAIYTKLGPKLPANALSLSKVNDKNIGNFAASVFGSKAMQAAASSGASSVGLASSRSSDPASSALLKEAEKKAGLDLVGSGKGLSYKKTETKDGMNFNFAGDSAASQAQAPNFQATEKNYNYKNSDISKKSDTSIFEIISNRYIQSGLKRLFEN